MKTIANMKSQFIKISWGIVEIRGIRVYCELWLSTGMMDLKVKFKVPNGMSVSYSCTSKDCPFNDGSFLSYWIPKNVYFPVHFCGSTVNELVELVVEHLNLRFFTESHKWTIEKDDVLAARLRFVSGLSFVIPRSNGDD